MSTVDEQDEYFSSVKELHRRRLRLLEQQAARRGDNTPPEIVMEMEDIQAKIEELDHRLAGEPITYAPHLRIHAEQATRENTRSRRDYNKWLLPTVFSTMIAIAVIGGLANYYGAARGEQKAITEIQPTITAASVLGQSTGRQAAITEIQPTIAAANVLGQNTGRQAAITEIQPTIAALKNRLVESENFEDNSDEGWSKINSTYYYTDVNKPLSRFPDDKDFPGQISTNASKDSSLVGKGSLRIRSDIKVKGRFRNYLTKQVSFLPNGANMYVMIPSTQGISDIQASLCTSNENCSIWTTLIQGKWTPLTVDWGKTDLRFQDITLRIDYETQSRTSFDVYIDAVSFFNLEQ